MTVHLVAFSDESMSRAAGICLLSGAAHGVTNVITTHHRDLLKSEFYAEHNALLSRARGLGFWAWKPFIIERSMRSLSNGDILIYADAGVEFINNVSHVIDRMDQDIFLFGNNWEHAHWCKRDIVEAVWPCNKDSNCPRPHYDVWDKFGKQCQASVIFFRVSDYSKQFVAEWLKWCLHRLRYSTICTDEWRYLIDDSPSILPNHPEFRENRHDQAILTTLAYREGIKLHYWPASYNDGAFTYEKLPEYAGYDYPIMFSHHRRRNHEWEKVA